MTQPDLLAKIPYAGGKCKSNFTATILLKSFSTESWQDFSRSMTNAEIAVRSSAGFYLFVPYGYDERVIGQCGLQLLLCEDLTAKLSKSPAPDTPPAH